MGQSASDPESATAWCEGTLVESGDVAGECSSGAACTALDLRSDYPAYRAAHERVVSAQQNASRTEYGGES